MKPDFTQIMLDLKVKAYNPQNNTYSFKETNHVLRNHLYQRKKRLSYHFKQFVVLILLSSLFLFLSFCVCKAAYNYIHFTDPVVDVFLIITNYTLAVLLTKKLV